MPTVPSAGEPPRTPLTEPMVTPAGVPAESENVGAGEPVAVTAKELGVLTTNVAELPLVIVGGATRLSVKLALIGMSTALPERQFVGSEASAENPPRLST